MKILINGKTFENWTEDDLLYIIDNEEYREGDSIEYKENFAFNSVSKNEKKDNIIEYKDDICSFANTNGGLFLCGITEKDGIPKLIVGIDIGNIDNYELDLRNKMNGITPAIPQVDIRFIPLISGKKVVVLNINKGYFVPYISTMEENQKSRFLTRRGNGKSVMSYSELKNKFNDSLSLKARLKNFIDERIEYDRERNALIPVLLLHIIPDTFINDESYKKIYLMNREKFVKFTGIFGSFLHDQGVPNVDGVLFDNKRYDNGTAVQFFDNGSAELSLDLLKSRMVYEKSASEKKMVIQDVVNHIGDFISSYLAAMKLIIKTERVFISISLLQCKNIIAGTRYYDIPNLIDRNLIKTSIIEHIDSNVEDNRDEILKKILIEFLLSCGVTDFNKFIIYGS